MQENQPQPLRKRRPLKTLDAVIGAQAPTAKQLAQLAQVDEAFRELVSPIVWEGYIQGYVERRALNQFLLSSNELVVSPHLLDDPVDEAHYQVAGAPFLVHTYGNRLAIEVTSHCRVHCRFCFRKMYIDTIKQSCLSPDQWDQVIAYIIIHPEIDDLVLTGGDPLMVSLALLLPQLRRILALPQIKVLRFDTRGLTMFPERINSSFIQFLRENAGRILFLPHVNHASELAHPLVQEKLKLLLETGCRVLTQSVILRSVNDEVGELRSLVDTITSRGVKAYRLYVMDQVQGAEHFMLSAAELVSVLVREFKGLSPLNDPEVTYIDPNTDQKVSVLATASPQEIAAFVEGHELACAEFLRKKAEQAKAVE
jgi:KamA family protein